MNDKDRYTFDATFKSAIGRRSFSNRIATRSILATSFIFIESTNEATFRKAEWMKDSFKKKTTPAKIVANLSMKSEQLLALQLLLPVYSSLDHQR